MTFAPTVSPASSALSLRHRPARALLLSLTRALLLSLMGLLLVITTACDLQGVEDAADDFQVVVELPEINTVASVQALDLKTRAPISKPVTLSFEGPDAGAVIDAFSDPMATASFKGGFTSFGIANGRVPSADRPVRLTVTARADGYQDVTLPVALTDTGVAPVRLKMMREHPRHAPQGVTGIRRTGKSENGEVARPIEAASKSDRASGIRLPKGTGVATADGTPLEGRLTADVHVFDNSPDGLSALPASARAQADGRVTLQAMRVKVTDAQGRVAAQFTAPKKTGAPRPPADPARPKSGAVAKSGTTGLSFTLSTGAISTAMDLTHYVLRLTDGLNQVDVYVPLTAVEGESLTFGVDGNSLIVGDERHDISDLVATQSSLAAGSGLYLSLQGVAPATCTPSGTITIDPNGQSGTVTVAASGNGLLYEQSVSVTAGQTASLSVATLVSDPTLPSLSTEWPVVAIAPNGETTSANVDLCGGATTPLTLPAPTATTIDATVRIEPGCPAGQSIPFTGSIDGYVLNYRKSGSMGDFQPVPGGAVTVHATNTAFERADVGLTGVEPSTDYEFYGAFDGQTGTRILTMPATDGGTITFTDTEISKHCQ